MELKIFADIQKVDDEQRLVYGYASTTALDTQGERITKEALSEALPEYLKFSNIREMHQPSAVGVAENIDIDDKGIYLVAKVVDDNAWKKVKSGVYKGFSIGGKSLSKIDNVIEKLRISEISLVDRPANPECVIQLYKFDSIEKTQTDTESQTEEKSQPSDDKETIPAADVSESTEKSEISIEIQKGMWGISQLANLLDQLNGLKACSEWEAESEGDNSPIPAKLKEAVANLGQILNEMVVEETAELTAEDDATAVDVIAYSEKTDDIEKAGARNSKGDSGRIQKMHDMSIELGANCGGADSAKSQHAAGDDIKKIEDLKNDIQKLTQTNKVLQKRVTELEDLPQPPKGSLRAVNKSEDIITEEKDDISKIQDAQGIIKAIHKSPTPYIEFLAR